MIVFGLLSLLTIVNSQFTQEHLSQLKSLTCNDPSVTVHVFSGTPNPVWKIDAKQLSQIKARADRTLSRSANLAGLNRQSTRVMGYHGFTVSCSAEESVFIHGISPLEQLLLRGGRRYLQATVARHVEEHLGDILADITQTTSSNADCNSVPIKGPDTVPKYDPNSDDSGCFVKKQSENNCYAYGTDIVTNSFPQPGRGSGKKWSFNTCADMGNASVRDGLIYNGTALPKGPPLQGHFAALLIWPETNFHWIRMDVNGYWSHKPGGTPVRNKDNEGSLITDPSKSDFSPWTQFCYYFIAQPSKLKIN